MFFVFLLLQFKISLKQVNVTFSGDVFYLKCKAILCDRLKSDVVGESLSLGSVCLRVLCSRSDLLYLYYESLLFIRTPSEEPCTFHHLHVIGLKEETNYVRSQQVPCFCFVSFLWQKTNTTISFRRQPVEPNFLCKNPF